MMSPQTRSLPTGEVTFLFTDIEDSTALLRELGPERYSAALQEHRRAIRDALGRNGGVEVDTQGDAFFVAFGNARAALSAATEMQRALEDGPISVRIGLHTGTPIANAEGYVGEDVHLGARIAAAGYGGQVLVSRQTRQSALNDLDPDELVDLGEHRVKGFDDPVWIFQVGSAAFPPLRTVSNTNLPRPASRFIGREADVERLNLMLRDGARLVTLTGPGGTGKTRLAIEAAATLAQDFKNGVFWVPLAAVSDPLLVTQTIAETIGAKSGLAEHIADRQMLLVLDNLEQVVTAAPEIASLVASCHSLRVVVTSRELLRVGGEVEYAVQVLNDTDGAQLFSDRSALPVDAAMVELCRRLDNLPLAIELAAARTRVFSVEEIQARLGQVLDLLKGGRDSDPRQQTLRATISWSFELLEPQEQQLFQRLAGFRGGCTYDAAEAVADAELDVLQSLLEKSLVRRLDGRFRMLETIREFGLERLTASNELDALARRHAEYYTDYVEHAETRLTGPQQDAWWGYLTDEVENVRAALEWSCRGGSPVIALRLSGVMWRYWWQRGHYTEGKRWYAAALSIGADEDEALRAQALLGLGSMEMGLGNTTKAIELFGVCLEIFRREANYSETVRTLTDLGIAYTDAERYEEAKASFEEALAMTRAAGEVRRSAVNLINLGDLALIQRDLDSAAELFKAAFDGMGQVGDAQSAGNALGNLAQVELLRGNLDSAAGLFADALRRSQQTNDRYSILHSMIGVAALFYSLGELSQSSVFFGCVDALQREMDIAINPGEQKLMDETIANLRTRLPRTEMEEMFDRGRSMNGDDRLDLFLRALDSQAQRPGSAAPTASG